MSADNLEWETLKRRLTFTYGMNSVIQQKLAQFVGVAWAALYLHWNTESRVVLCSTKLASLRQRLTMLHSIDA